MRNNKEYVYYFFVDNWGDEPKLCLMERAVKHARIMAEIKAPSEIIKQCVKEQGTSSNFEKSYAINEPIKEWLIDHVLDKPGDSQLVVPRLEKSCDEDMGPPLPLAANSPFTGETDPTARGNPILSTMTRLPDLLRKWNFFDSEVNPRAGLSIAWSKGTIQE